MPDVSQVADERVLQLLLDKNLIELPREIDYATANKLALYKLVYITRGYVVVRPWVKYLAQTVMKRSGGEGELSDLFKLVSKSVRLPRGLVLAAAIAGNKTGRHWRDFNDMVRDLLALYADAAFQNSEELREVFDRALSEVVNLARKFEERWLSAEKELSELQKYRKVFDQFYSVVDKVEEVTAKLRMIDKLIDDILTVANALLRRQDESLLDELSDLYEKLKRVVEDFRRTASSLRNAADSFRKYVEEIAEI